MARALAPHLKAGDAAQFPVNQRHQPTEGIVSAKPDLSQQPGHLSASVRHMPPTLSSPDWVF